MKVIKTAKELLEILFNRTDYGTAVSGHNMYWKEGKKEYVTPININTSCNNEQDYFLPQQDCWESKDFKK